MDQFTLALLGVVALAAALPARGTAAPVAQGLAVAAIALLFFLHGAKLSRRALRAGLLHWRLHLLVFACTFGLFPLLGVALRPALEPLTGALLWQGMLFVCLLPATVQSAIAFTSIARGNVAAAVCSAAASSLIGIIVTPLLVLWLMDAQAGSVGVAPEAARGIVLQLLVPFLAGQLARPWLGGWIGRHPRLVRATDQGSILLVIYSAFSASVVGGLWQLLPLPSLLALGLACAVLLAIVLALVWQLASRLGFVLEDRITILFAGSKKSMAAGVPMAQILFQGALLGPLLLPLLVFHQLQLMVCAVLARRFAAREHVDA